MKRIPGFSTDAERIPRSVERVVDVHGEPTTVVSVTVDLHPEAYRILTKMQAKGIHGRTVPEICLRMIDHALVGLNWD